MQHDYSLVFETDNEYWTRVLEIFEKNEKYPKKKVSNRNLHHKFPRSFSKMLGEPVDNDSDNLISLSLADHFLVHYYYYLLAKKGFRQRMATAFTFMAKKCLKFMTPDTAERMAKDYEEAQVIANQLRSEHIKQLWVKGTYEHIHDNDTPEINKFRTIKRLNTISDRYTAEEINQINYKKGKTLRGKTYEEAFGKERAYMLRKQRSESNRNRDYSNYKYKGESLIIRCLETGELHTYSEWCKLLNLKSKSSIANVLDKPNKCCRKLHFIRMQ